MLKNEIWKKSQPFFTLSVHPDQKNIDFAEIYLLHKFPICQQTYWNNSYHLYRMFRHTAAASS